MRTIRWVMAIPAAVLTGCVATQSDIRVLQGDLSLIRAENAAADSARRVQLDRVLASVHAANDSVVALSNRMTKFRSDVTTSMQSIDEQLLAIQELTGQSQRRLQEMRASLEERQATMPPAGTPAPAGGSQPSASEPGPNQLFQIAREQMMQGSNGAARQAFEDLLQKYPKADVAGQAQYYIAETYAAEGNSGAADSVYAQVVSKYAGSPSAATALYKRAQLAQGNGKSDEAQAMYKQLIKKYPRSDEAALAKDILKRAPGN
jgi:tol-pal system protein YbgF